MSEFSERLKKAADNVKKASADAVDAIKKDAGPAAEQFTKSAKEIGSVVGENVKKAAGVVGENAKDVASVAGQNIKKGAADAYNVSREKLSQVATITHDVAQDTAEDIKRRTEAAKAADQPEPQPVEAKVEELPEGDSEEN